MQHSQKNCWQHLAKSIIVFKKRLIHCVPLQGAQRCNSVPSCNRYTLCELADCQMFSVDHLRILLCSFDSKDSTLRQSWDYSSAQLHRETNLCLTTACTAALSDFSQRKNQEIFTMALCDFEFGSASATQMWEDAFLWFPLWLQHSRCHHKSCPAKKINNAANT